MEALELQDPTTSATTSAMGFGARLLSEFDALRELPALGSLLYVIVVLVLASAIAWVGPALVRTVWRIGFDPRRRLGLLTSATRLGGLLLACFALLRPLFERAPTLGALLLLLLVALAGLVAPTQLHNLASGLALSTRKRLREGDLIRVGELEGTVRDIALLHVDLRTVDGGITQIPAADFDRQPVTIGSRRAAVPITTRVVVGPGFGQAELERLRRALSLCAYRRANTQVRIEHDPVTRMLVVQMDTWANTAVAEVEQHVRALLLELTTNSTTEVGG